MSLTAQVVDGQLVTTSTTSSSSTSSTSSSSSLDKESFLQLLVAQMKYQDPLEPTSNTEYISQYAQFSQVESLSNMSSNLDLQRGASLVGQQVCINTTTSSGDTSQVVGKVDYVTYENGSAYVYVNETRYSLDDVETILDSDYLEAYDLATSLVTAINKLPAVANLSLSDADTVDELNETYQNMTDYQKGFVATDKVTSLNSYVAKLAELRKLNGEDGDE